MAITTVLDLRLTPDTADEALRDFNEILKDTRAFDGCLGVSVVRDRNDPAHVLVIERWASIEQDSAYRAWRAGAGASSLASWLAAPPVVTFTDELADV